MKRVFMELELDDEEYAIVEELGLLRETPLNVKEVLAGVLCEWLEEQRGGNSSDGIYVLRGAL